MRVWRVVAYRCTVSVTNVKHGPPNHSNARMMIDMEESKLGLLLPQDDEEGVKVIQELRDVVDEAEVFDAHAVRRVEGERVGQGRHDAETVDHVDVEHDLDGVVDLHRQLELVGLALLHELAANRDHSKVHRQTNAQGGLGHECVIRLSRQKLKFVHCSGFFYEMRRGRKFNPFAHAKAEKDAVQLFLRFSRVLAVLEHYLA